jgi:hypothetical protein
VKTKKRSKSSSSSSSSSSGKKRGRDTHTDYNSKFIKDLENNYKEKKALWQKDYDDAILAKDVEIETLNEMLESARKVSGDGGTKLLDSVNAISERARADALRIEQTAMIK